MYGRLTLALSLMCSIIVVSGCEADNETTLSSEEVGSIQQALSYTFTIPRNPTSRRSSALRITVTPASGGTLNWFTIGDNSPFFEAFSGILNTRNRTARTAYFPCADYGSAYANVVYTGARPRVQYYWTDCR